MSTYRRSYATFITLLLALVLALGALSVPSKVYADDEGGNFALAAIDSEGTIIEPYLVEFDEGDSIKDALKKSGHDFYDIDSDWIYSIDGHDDNYMRFYDGGQYNLDLPATEIHEAMFFTVNELEDPSNHLRLIKLLAEYSTKDEKLQKYGPVKKAYAAGIEALPTANQSKAGTLADDLQAAYDRYEAWTHQDTCHVTVNPIQDGEPAEADVTLTDTMGNVYEQSGTECEFDILEETYEFRVRKGCHEVSGTLEIGHDDTSKSISPELPSGNWVGPIRLRDTDKVNAETVTEGDTTTAKILDTTYSPYINIVPGKDIPLDSEGKPDTKNYSVFADYTSFAMGTYRGNENDANQKITWSSNAKRLIEVSEAGLVEKTIPLKVIHKDPETGYTQRQYHDLVLKKIPTIKGIRLVAGKNDLNITTTKMVSGAPQVVTGPADEVYDVRYTEYTAETIADTVSISGFSYVDKSDTKELCGKYSEGYSIEVNGTPQEEDGSVNVPVTGEPVTITVRGANGLSSSCSVTVSTVGAKTIEVTKPSANVSAVLKTSTGSILEPDEDFDDKAVFQVAPGKYTWITTLEDHYHVSGTVETGSGSEAVTIAGIKPKKEELIHSLDSYSGITQNAMHYQMADGESFSWQDHEYTFLMSDFATSVYVLTTFDSGVTVTREPYRMNTGVIRPSGTLKSGTRDLLTRLISQGIRNNSVVLTASKKSGDVTYYQDYIFKTRRFDTLESLEVHDKAGNALNIFANGDENENEFDSDITEYTLKIGETADQIRLTAGFSNPSQDAASIGDYTISMGGASFKKSESEKIVSQDVALDPAKDEEDIYIELSDDNPENSVNAYHIKVIKVPPVTVRFNTDPANATVFVTDDISKARIPAEDDGSISLLKGFHYTYTATAYGYIGKQGSIAMDENGTVDISLYRADQNAAIDTSITAEWPYFRADEFNNGVVDLPVPKDPDDTVLYWAKKIGEGYSGSAAGCPILVDGYVYTYTGGTIMKLDAMTGEIVATGEMVTGSAFAINNPTYAEGMIFIGLNNGCIQAFNAKTLESLWVYRDRLGGQPNCQISYKDGYIYTGFWNSETKEAQFVCLSVTDEIPKRATEEKLPTWTYTGKGFYWAGAYVSDNYAVVGSDDGKAGYSSGCGVLLSFDPLTGKIIDQIDDQFTGDIRSSICFDEESKKCYFATKDGLFCSIKMNDDGTFAKNTITKLQLTEMNGAKGMSTSTPVVHNGRAYVGVSGVGTFSQYTGHNITVIDLEGSRPVIAYRVATQGYPQTSGFLTTAYDEGDGSVYVYYFDNFTPGKLRMIKDRPGLTEPDPETLDTEEYEQSGMDKTCDVASTLFTPYGDQAQYAICSPIADEWGNIYFKNDSAYMMMIGAKITELKVTKKPDKTSYNVGEVFDPRGMKVTATYANGKTRDVTKYIKYTTDPLTAEDTEIVLLFDVGENMKMYHDFEGEAGVEYFVPETSVSVTVRDSGFTPTLLTSMELVADELEYTGETVRPQIKSINGLTTLAEGTDYTVDWPESSVEPGQYTVTISGKGNYTGFVSATYTIKRTVEPEELTSIALSETEFKYNGNEQRPKIALLNDTDTLKEGRDYTVDWPEESYAVGTYTVTVHGIGNYTGTVSATYVIKEADKLIELTSLELSENDFYFTGETQRPEIYKVNGSTWLKEYTDYTVTWPEESVDAGTYTVTVTGKGNFTGSVSATYTIHEPKEQVELTSVRLTWTEREYNESSQMPKISQVNEDYELEEGRDYIVTWPEESVNVGTYTVTVAGIGDYFGVLTAEYSITPFEIDEIDLSSYKFTYNGKSHVPAITAVEGKDKLQENVDYTVTRPSKSVNAGTYTIKVKGIGNYTGTASEKYTISKASNKITAKPTSIKVKRKKKALLKVSCKGGAKITVKATKNKKYVKVVKKGKKFYIQGVKKGKAEVTVTTAATKNYKKTTKKVKVTIK